MIEDILGQKRFRIIVKANARKNMITGVDDKEKALKVSIAAPAEKNRANLEIIKFFSRKLKKKVRIVSGFTGKIKTIAVAD